MSSGKGQTTRALTEGALLAALTVVLYVANVYTQFLVYIIPVPVAILVVRHGLRTGAVASAVAALGIGLILGPLDAITVLIRIALVGLLMGGLMARRARALSTLLATAAAYGAVVISDLLIVAVTSRLSVSQVLDQLKQGIEQASAQVSSMYEQLGMSQQALESTRTMMEQLPQAFELFLPTILLFGAIMAALISYTAARWVLKRTKIDVEALPPFGRWRLGWAWAWGLIAALLLGQLTARVGGTAAQSATSNVIMMYVLLYTVMGASVGWGLLEHYKVSVGFRIVILVMLYMTPPFTWALALAGLLDGWMDFRRLVSRKA